uniref:terpene synthase family protein n=1 Tax=Streptomyces niveus TaxID=193462 RepID=UPI0038B62B9A
MCCCAGRTIGVYPTVDLAERIGRFEVPEHVYADNVPKAIRHVAAEVDTIHNDLCSVEKEEARGEIHNLLLILEKWRRCTRAEAVEEMCRMIRSRTERFLVLEAAVPALCDSLRLTEAQRVSVRRFADSLLAVMRGDYDWAEQSGRYANENIPREQETAQ